jgi:signal transduction histidine kinase
MPANAVVMVVDDDAQLRLLVAEVLRRAGHEIVEAADGEEALRLLDERLPDLILTDLVMPKVDGAQLIEEVLAQARILAEARSIHLRLGPAEPVSTQGDHAHLRRLLLNLVDNGIKYTPPGGQVTISLQSDGRWASIQVEDTGIGIPAEDQARIFQRFYRSAEARLRGEGGTGLGLCIARSIAEAHGGRIELESTPGRGSTFTVLLPIES